ncbi:hypothetical protein F5888DRAFT_1262808 [Russula emetica]|nr:hypothetical protein F5888DRAFT_1262808 [Russula emetica]
MPSGHLSRQLRFVLPGAAITYWFNTPSLLARIWADAAPLARPLVGLSLFSGLLTIALFLYILLIPLIKGIPPNYRSWRKSGELSSVIPVRLLSHTFLPYRNSDVFFFFLDPRADENDGSGHHRSLCRPVVLLCAFLGLDGIDHLGLGGGLRRAWTVFRYGIHTWHYCRIWIICSRVRHYGSTSRSKSCSTVTPDSDMRAVRLHTRRVSISNQLL